MRQSLTAAERRTQVVEAKVKLLEMLKPGDTLHTILRQVSRSGASRHISVILVRDSEPSDITWLVARVLVYRRDEHDGGIVISGGGMDMGFDLVYRLGYTLWPTGFTCAGETCHSNDHSNGDRDRTPHHHTDGGYALKQQWL